MLPGPVRNTMRSLSLSAETCGTFRRTRKRASSISTSTDMPNGAGPPGRPERSNEYSFLLVTASFPAVSSDQKQQEPEDVLPALLFWCPGQDSNLHARE